VIYNKVMLLHLNPSPPGPNVPPLLTVYELDPTYSYRLPTQVFMNPSSHGHLIQMQIVENLIALHDIDGKWTQAYDIKIGNDFGCGLLKEGCQVTEGKGYLMEVIGEEETTMNDDTYKLTQVPL
jgi:hypothetical protein